MNAIVLLSGGIDSLVALDEAIDCERHCTAMSFDYGQKNRKELECARRIAERYSVELLTCKLDAWFWLGTSFLTGGSTNTLDSYVPSRNLLLISHAIAAAEARGAREVWFGGNRDDHAVYPDTRPEFLAAVNEVAKRGTKSEIHVIAPHASRTKTQVIRRGISLGVPFELTTSCADAGDCGVCRGCVLTRDAFAKARMS